MLIQAEKSYRNVGLLVNMQNLPRAQSRKTNIITLNCSGNKPVAAIHSRAAHNGCKGKVTGQGCVLKWHPSRHLFPFPKRTPQACFFPFTFPPLVVTSNDSPEHHVWIWPVVRPYSKNCHLSL